MEAGRLVWDGNSGLLPLCFGISQTPIIIKDPTSSQHSRSCPCPQSHVPLQKTMGSEGAFTHSMETQGQKDADVGQMQTQGQKAIRATWKLGQPRAGPGMQLHLPFFSAVAPTPPQDKASQETLHPPLPASDFTSQLRLAILMVEPGLWVF